MATAQAFWHVVPRGSVSRGNPLMPGRAAPGTPRERLQAQPCEPAPRALPQQPRRGERGWAVHPPSSGRGTLASHGYV